MRVGGTMATLNSRASPESTVRSDTNSTLNQMKQSILGGLNFATAAISSTLSFRSAGNDTPKAISPMPEKLQENFNEAATGAKKPEQPANRTLYNLL